MTNPRPRYPLIVLLAVATILFACGGNRSLQSVSLTPADAASHAQYHATGMYNQSPTTADITASTTWCIGSTSGMCAGNIMAGATVNAGLAQCSAGFTGAVTVLAGEASSPTGPDKGFQLKPFGMAQLTCP